MAHLHEEISGPDDGDTGEIGPNDREATELTSVAANHSESNPFDRHPPPASTTPQAKGYLISFGTSVKSFWLRQVSPTVSHEACRDHLGTPAALCANTFLAHLLNAHFSAILGLL